MIRFQVEETKRHPTSPNRNRPVLEEVHFETTNLDAYLDEVNDAKNIILSLPKLQIVSTLNLPGSKLNEDAIIFKTSLEVLPLPEAVATM